MATVSFITPPNESARLGHPRSFTNEPPETAAAPTISSRSSIIVPLPSPTKKPGAWKTSSRQRYATQIDGNLEGLALKISQYYLENDYKSGIQLRVMLYGIGNELKALRNILRSSDGSLKLPFKSKLSDCNTRDSPVKYLDKEIQLRLFDADQNHYPLSSFNRWKNFASASSRGFPARGEKQKANIALRTRFSIPYARV
jgi:hypothetical protein